MTYDAPAHLSAHLDRVRLFLEGSESVDALAAHARAMSDREHDALPLVMLQRRLGLSRTACDLLVVAAASSLDVSIAMQVRERMAGATPTVEELISMVAIEPDSEARVLAELSPDAPLASSGLIELVGPDATPLQRRVQVDERVVGFLAGSEAIDRRIRDAIELRAAAPATIEPAAVATIERELEGPLVVEGAALIGKTSAIVAAIAMTGRRTIIADLAQLAAGDAGALSRARREAMLFDAALVLRAGDWDPAWPPALRRRVIELVQSGAAILSVRDAAEPCRVLRGARRVRIGMPTVVLQQRIWNTVLGSGLATFDFCVRYPLPPGDIIAAAEAAVGIAATEQRAPTLDDLTRCARDRMTHRLGDVAELVSTTASWRDVVLREDVANRVRELVGAIKSQDRVLGAWGFAEKLPYGRSISALLSGPPGTGKTMVATVLGKELDLEVFRVDLSKVTSKFIGETEKNLARVFDEAARCRAILLFDEADSLFSKRTEVRNSNDKFANLEVNYLLQRLETHEGVVLLTTNAASSIDRAFLRRIRFRIEFPEPDVAERVRLWRSMIPPAAPLADDVDLEALGRRFAMTGGHIKNAVVRAAYRAINEGREAIDQEALVGAALAEWTELGNLTPPSTQEPVAVARGSQPRVEPIGISVWRAPPDPGRPPSDGARVGSTTERTLLSLLTGSSTPGLTISAEYSRREQDIRTLFASLSVVEARALHRRLTILQDGDALGTHFMRLSADRRMRLIAFLGDARRREATKQRAS
jgi:SpoVK/Ycf46/Vps4 family AAA+-type ATPase